jgi:hypothetical protein
MAWGIVVILILQLVYKAWESRYLFTNAHLEMLNSKYIILLMVEQMSLSHQRLTNWNIAETQIFGCSNYFFHFKIGFFFHYQQQDIVHDFLEHRGARQPK